MNFLSAASKFRKGVEREVKALNNIPDEFKVMTDEQWRERVSEQRWKELELDMRLGIRMMKKFKEIAVEEGLYGDKEHVKCTYFITIRPDFTSISFADFYTLVEKFVARKCFLWFKLSFEQKGLEPEEYGKGFHAHIVAYMRQRSKTEVLRDTVSTFKGCTSSNCIQVDILKSQSDVDNVVGYITDYVSDDDHKIQTRNADELWREQVGLLPQYTESDLVGSHLPDIKSRIRQAIMKPERVLVSFD